MSRKMMSDLDNKTGYYGYSLLNREMFPERIKRKREIKVALF